MARGELSHIDLTVADVERSYRFYDPIMRFLGFSGGALEKHARSAGWINQATGFSIAIHTAKPESAHIPHDRYAPGLHHLAFRAEGRDEVDALYRMLLEGGAQILDPPQEYPAYARGYYAVFFGDPDGLKLEVVHLPKG